ncbi:MAG: hypothetical protein IJF84_09440 [Thermoguttaceae bacterium]|nr:hypothetical protein [Thermoguttaceae bacterium]
MDTEDSNSTPQSDRDKLNDQLDELRESQQDDGFVYKADGTKVYIMCYQTDIDLESDSCIGSIAERIFFCIFFGIIGPIILLILFLRHPIQVSKALYHNIPDEVEDYFLTRKLKNYNHSSPFPFIDCFIFWSAVVALALLFWGWKTLFPPSAKRTDSPAPTAIESVTPADKQTDPVSRKSE